MRLCMGKSVSPIWLEVIKVLATVIIGAMAAWIAYTQANTNRKKYKLDRFDKRFRIYEELRRLLYIVQQNARVELSELFHFRAIESEADFLFGPEIRQYLDEVTQQVINLNTAASEFRDLSQPAPESYDHQAVVAAKGKALSWLTSQFEIAREKFRPYLDVSE